MLPQKENTLLFSNAVWMKIKNDRPMSFKAHDMIYSIVTERQYFDKLFLLALQSRLQTVREDGFNSTSVALN